MALGEINFLSGFENSELHPIAAALTRAKKGFANRHVNSFIDYHDSTRKTRIHHPLPRHRRLRHHEMVA